MSQQHSINEIYTAVSAPAEGKSNLNTIRRKRVMVASDDDIANNKAKKYNGQSNVQIPVQLTTTPSRQKLSRTLKFCHNLLDELFSDKYFSIAWPFYDAAKVNQLGLLSFNNSIPMPLDLCTIRRKLYDGIYANPIEFGNDMRSMFGNWSRMPCTPLNSVMELQPIFERNFSIILQNMENYPDYIDTTMNPDAKLSEIHIKLLTLTAEFDQLYLHIVSNKIFNIPKSNILDFQNQMQIEQENLDELRIAVNALIQPPKPVENYELANNVQPPVLADNIFDFDFPLLNENIFDEDALMSVNFDN